METDSRRRLLVTQTGSEQESEVGEHMVVEDRQSIVVKAMKVKIASQGLSPTKRCSKNGRRHRPLA